MFESPLLAYGWWYGWFWWWWFAIFVIFWLMLFEPFAWGRGWYIRRYGRGLRSVHSDWDLALSHYVESPQTGLNEADAIVTPLVGRAHGGDAATEYAAAHRIALAAQRGEADERGMREAMASYLHLYNALA